MNDITELAQSHELRNKVNHRLYGALEFQGTSGEHATVTLSIDECKSIIAALDERLALVEALEKAQDTITEMDNRIRKQNRHVCELFDNNTVLRQRIAEPESRTVSAAAADVLAERQRQVAAEGWTPEHDDEHSDGEMALAASSYALYAHKKPIAPAIPYNWPWEPEWFKQQGARRDLVKAGALILAEIERLDRAAGIKWEAE